MESKRDAADGQRHAAAAFGQGLRALRGQRGSTLDDVSDRLTEIGVTVSPGYISRIERNERGVSLDFALAVCRALDVALADLLGGAVMVGNAPLTGGEIRHLCARYPLRRPDLEAELDVLERLAEARLLGRIAELDLDKLVQLRSDLRRVLETSEQEE